MSLRRPTGSIVSNSVTPLKKASKTRTAGMKLAGAAKAYANKAGLRQNPVAGAKQALSAFKAGRARKKLR